MLDGPGMVHTLPSISNTAIAWKMDREGKLRKASAFLPWIYENGLRYRYYRCSSNIAMALKPKIQVRHYVRDGQYRI